jgi:PIN domain-containing protein
VKNRFPGHYRPTDTEFGQLWAECYFVPDTNILLHLFRYGENTRTQVLDTLTRLKPRVWIPFRVGFEFHRRWREVDYTNRAAYDRLSSEIQSQGRSLGGLFNQYSRHQIIDAKAEQTAIDEFIKTLCSRLSNSKAKHPGEGDAERIFLKISELIGEAVGSRPSKDEFEKMIKEGEARYANEIPPGYLDGKNKPVPDKFGDYFIWRELLDKAKQEKKARNHDYG